jgi:D-alanyl-D-alanine carboxypeptidase
MRLITVVTGAESENARTTATQSMLNYGFRFYETKKMFSAGETLTTAKIWKADTDRIDLGLQRDLYITIARGQFDKLNKHFDLPEKIIAPAAAGSEQGRLRLVLADKEVISAPLVAIHSVSEGGFFRRIQDDIRLFFE